MYLSSLTLSTLHFFVSVTQTFHNVTRSNPCLLSLHKFSSVSHTKGQDHAQASKPTQPTCTPPQGLVLMGAPRLRSHKENGRQTEPPTDARSMQHGQRSHQAHSPRSASTSTLYASSKRVMQGPAANRPDVTAARRYVITARRCSRRRAGALAAVGAEARAAGRVERSAVRAAAAGRRWAGARGQVRGRRSPWARPRFCKSPGRTPGLPLGVGRAPGGVGTVLLQGPAAVAAPAGLSSPSILPPGGGKPRQQRAPGAAGSWDRPLTAAVRGVAELSAPHSVPGRAMETPAHPAARDSRVGWHAAHFPDGKSKA